MPAPSRRIGLVYELLGERPLAPGEPRDAHDEYEPETTVEALEAALRRLGCEPVRLGGPRALLALAGKGGAAPVEAALNIAEGERGRNREAWAPILLELLGVPTLGSDALTLSLSLDKAWAKDVVAAAGVPCTPHASLERAAECEAAAERLGLPLFVKPRWEGTAKGIGRRSRVETLAELEEEVARVVRVYRQPALVEPFLAGPEYTVCVSGHAPARAWPALQRALERGSRIGLHALAGEHGAGDLAGDATGVLAPELDAELGRLSLRAFDALRCRDYARVDWKLDRDGAPRFLEINPLPTFAVDGSFAILAELLGEPYDAFLAGILAEALRRLDL
ncbi:MAG TPA: D-alanine--D-alanine ligase [Myxococcota bacterium]|nr:D-alanine--D-alanine ligase [Myxococcota bacterium]